MTEMPVLISKAAQAEIKAALASKPNATVSMNAMHERVPETTCRSPNRCDRCERCVLYCCVLYLTKVRNGSIVRISTFLVVSPRIK